MNEARQKEGLVERLLKAAETMFPGDRALLREAAAALQEPKPAQQKEGLADILREILAVDNHGYYVVPMSADLRKRAAAALQEPKEGVTECGAPTRWVMRDAVGTEWITSDTYRLCELKGFSSVPIRPLAAHQGRDKE